MTLWLLSWLPRNLLSFCMGKLASIPWPRPVNGWINHAIGKAYKIAFDEAEKPATEYASFNQFFTRKLKAGARPIADATLVHPCDSVIAAEGSIETGMLFQAKGIDYPLSELLQNNDSAERLLGGHFITYYLCPRDYHRVHSPVDGEIATVLHIPGTLWPVNMQSVQKIKNLYCVNERMIIEITSIYGPVFVVMVGATNVGKISVAFDADIVSNQLCTKKVRTKKYLPRIPIKKGDEVGTFHLGSTVVLLLPPEAPVNVGVEDLKNILGLKITEGSAVKVGEFLA